VTPAGQLCRSPISQITISGWSINRSGDRQANAALYRIVVVRLRWHQPTQDYMARRLTQSKPKKEVIRCLIGGVSGARPVQESGRARGAEQGTAPLSCHPDGWPV